jgi:hypothetical protein
VFANNAARVVILIKALQSLVAYRPDHISHCNALRNGCQTRLLSNTR